MTFHEYLTEKDLPAIKDLTIDNLPDILMNFYTKVRKVNCENYKLKCIHAGINQFMKARKGIDIISNESFVKANEMF